MASAVGSVFSLGIASVIQAVAASLTARPHSTSSAAAEPTAQRLGQVRVDPRQGRAQQRQQQQPARHRPVRQHLGPDQRQKMNNTIVGAAASSRNLALGSSLRIALTTDHTRGTASHGVSRPASATSAVSSPAGSNRWAAPRPAWKVKDIHWCWAFHTTTGAISASTTKLGHIGGRLQQRPPPLRQHQEGQANPRPTVAA